MDTHTHITYLPSTVLRALEAEVSSNRSNPETGTFNDLKIPFSHQFETCVLFADISGFTAMCEYMASNNLSPEVLAKQLNSYFELLVKIVTASGGDIFKYAGDALLV